MTKITAAITAIGGYVPKFKLTNKVLEGIVDTTDEWITSRTGIKERRLLKPEEGVGSSYLAVKAVENMVEKFGVDTSDIEMVIVATVTPDMPVAATACKVATDIGAKDAFGFDLMAACSGFIYALSNGAKYIESGRYKKVLVIGADQMSSIIDYTDRTTCIIFGDGAGCALLEPNTEGYGLQDEILRSDGSGRDFLKVEAGGSLMPPSQATIDANAHFVRQEGKQVFRFAVTNMAGVSEEIMKRNNLTSDDIDWLVPHQANLRIIDATAKRMGLDKNKVMINITKYGNTTSGTLPLCLYDYLSQLKKGDNLILASFGGGFTWGALYIKWALDPIK